MDLSLIFKATGIVFRESLEAVLIYGIVVAFLKKLPEGAKAQVRAANWGLIAGVVGSIFLGGIVAGFLPTVEDSTFSLIEIFIVLGSSALMLYMVFWMSAHARTLKKELEGDLNAAIEKRSFFSVMAVVFLAVIREGAETVIYLYGLILETGSAARFSAITISFVIGIALSYSIYLMMTKGSRLVSTAKVFMITGIWLLISSSSLLATGIDKIFAAGYLEAWSEPIFSFGSESEMVNKGLGFFESLVGFRSSSTAINLIAFLVFWAFVFIADPLSLRRRKA